MEIVSTMGTGSLGREIDLQVLVFELEQYLGELVDANFHGSAMVTVRLKQNGPAYTIYRTGTFQIRGAKDEEVLFESFQHLGRTLEEIGVSISETEFRHATSVFVEDLDYEINLGELAIRLGLENIEYEPEQFPGLIYRPTDHEATVLIFASGKIIIGGTTDREHARDTVQCLEKELTFAGED